ncbi:hypothetical protein NKH18_49270 [Streptomyces sp. M10(2022)]
MSYQPNNSHFVPQATPPALALPQRGMRDGAQGFPSRQAPPSPARTPSRRPNWRSGTRCWSAWRVPAASEDFDELARDMAEKAGFLYGFVNLFLVEQTFVGLHQPPADSGYVIVGRTMSHDHGWCPEVVKRKRPSRCMTCTPAPLQRQPRGRRGRDPLLLRRPAHPRERRGPGHGLRH